MSTEVNTLLDLDRLEVSRLTLECVQASLSNKISERQNALASALADFTDKKNEVEACENSLYAFSGRVIMETGHINRLQSLSFENVGQREYEAIQADLMSRQEKIRHAREEQAKLRELLPGMRTFLEKVRIVFDDLEASLLPEMDALKNELAECMSELSQKTTKIAFLRGQLSPAVCSAWILWVESRSAAVRKGEQSSFLSEMSEEDHSCKLCFGELPKQFLADLGHCNSYLECPNCGCFLVFNPKKVARK